LMFAWAQARFDMKVREDFFASYAGDAAPFERGMVPAKERGMRSMAAAFSSRRPASNGLRLRGTTSSSVARTGASILLREALKSVSGNSTFSAISQNTPADNREYGYRLEVRVCFHAYFELAFRHGTILRLRHRYKDNVERNA
jgi:hypothetical protein